jgi:transcriptional regulator with XRE-family HTH domain
MEEVGQTLREARTQGGLSLDEVAQKTRIPKASLAHLEDGRFDLMPAAVFVRGFIRAYARVVGLDPNPLVRAYEAREARDEPRRPDAAMSYDAARVGAIGRHLGYGPPEEREPQSATRSTRGPRLDTDRKLVPLQPVSMRKEGGLRGGFMLIAFAAAGLLIAAWILVGQKKPAADGAAQAPAAPIIHERIDGMPAFDAPPAAPGVRVVPNPTGETRSGR